MNPTIVLIAYNRVDAVDRCLGSLLKASYPEGQNVRLIVSIDKSESNDVLKFVENFKWPFGDKEIIAHAENQGLKKHIFFCFSLSKKYEKVILLEDDSFVSPFFYDYSLQAIGFYGDDDNVCGISLYSYDHNEFVRMPFIPIDDGYDSIFMQVPSSLGQMVNRRMWEEFETYYSENKCELLTGDHIPASVFTWIHSWKKYYFKYMILTGKYFVYPRQSHTSNFCEAGTNFDSVRVRYQVNLTIGKRKYIFSNLSQAKSIYDGHYELKATVLGEKIGGISTNKIEFNLYGFKVPAVYKGFYFITPCDNIGQALENYGFDMWPPELNIIFGRRGDYFALISTDQTTGIFNHAKLRKNLAYFKADTFVIREKAYDDCEQNMKKTFTWRLGNFFLAPFKLFRKKRKK